jgi:hypothetical protein
MNYEIWFETHAMSPASQLDCLVRETGLAYTITNDEVHFKQNASEHPLAVELEGKVLRLGTWELIRDTHLPVANFGEENNVNTGTIESVSGELSTTVKPTEGRTRNRKPTE